MVYLLIPVTVYRTVLFRVAVKNRITRNPYERRLINFLNTIGMRADEFVDKAKNEAGRSREKATASRKFIIASSRTGCVKGISKCTD